MTRMCIIFLSDPTISQSAVTDREDRMTVEDGLNRRDFWGTVSVTSVAV